MDNPLKIVYNFIVVFDNDSVRIPLPMVCCSRCGAIISNSWTFDHTTWHERLELKVESDDI